MQRSQVLDLHGRRADAQDLIAAAEVNTVCIDNGLMVCGIAGFDAHALYDVVSCIVFDQDAAGPDIYDTACTTHVWIRGGRRLRRPERA